MISDSNNFWQIDRLVFDDRTSITNIWNKYFTLIINNQNQIDLGYSC